MALHNMNDERVKGIIPLNLEADEVNQASYMADLALNSDILMRKFMRNPSLVKQLWSKKDEESEWAEEIAPQEPQNFEFIDRALAQTDTKFLFVHSQWDAGRLWMEKHLSKAKLPHHFEHQKLQHMDHDVVLRSGQSELCKMVNKWLTSNFGAQQTQNSDEQILA